MSDSAGPDRLPPQSPEAERSVLGSMLRHNPVIGDVVLIVRAENFYSDAHQKIFQAIVSLYEKGQPVDIVLLAEELKQRGQLEDVGGYRTIAALYDDEPTGANAVYHARIVRDRAQVRNLIAASTEILRDAYDQVQPADEMVESAERRIMEIAQAGIVGQTFTLAEALHSAFVRIDKISTGESDSTAVPTGFTDLDEITAGLHANELIIVAARPSVGKCLAHDAEIVLADGSIATIEEIYRRRRARLLTLGEDWQFAWTEPAAFVDDGWKPVFRVTTRLGRTVESTLSHPYRTLSGWRPLAELQVGERIAVPRVLPVFGNEPLPEYKIKIAAYLIGDGCPTDVVPEFTSSNPLLRADFAEAVADFGALEVRYADSGGTRTPALNVAGDSFLRDTLRSDFGVGLRKAMRERKTTARQVAAAVGVSPHLVSFWWKGACAPNLDTFGRLCAVPEVRSESLVPHGLPSIQGGKNVLTRWLEELGLWGKDAHAKSIPPAFFRLPRPQVALLLNRLFATDGWAAVTGDKQAQLGYGTVSERLARQVQHLLLRFGIVSRLRRRAVKYRGTQRRAWQLEIASPESIRAFAEEIGMFGKEEALAAVLQALAQRKCKPNRDRIPISVWGDLDRARGGMSWNALARRAGLDDPTNIHAGRRCLSRARLLRLASVLGDESLQRLARGAVYWDEIVSIEPVGLKQVYDLSIPDTHNFVANDVCVHNTAFALGLVRNIVTSGKDGVFFVSLEQSRVELAERLLCSHARVDSHRLRKGTLGAEDFDRLIEAHGMLKGARLFIDDSPAQGMLRIAANARRLKLRQDIKLVVIDYLQLIEPDNRRDPRQEQVAQISRRLKFLAKELQIPVIALAQVNRASEDRQDHRPRLADLRESGSIEQDADTVLILHRPDRYEPGQHEGIIEVIVAKQRNGPTGEVTLAYLKQFMRYEDYAPGTPFDS